MGLPCQNGKVLRDLLRVDAFLEWCGDVMVSTVASGQEGPGFDPLGAFLAFY